MKLKNKESNWLCPTLILFRTFGTSPLVLVFPVPHMEHLRGSLLKPLGFKIQSLIVEVLLLKYFHTHKTYSQEDVCTLPLAKKNVCICEKSDKIAPVIRRQACLSRRGLRALCSCCLLSLSPRVILVLMFIQQFYKLSNRTFKAICMDY